MELKDLNEIAKDVIADMKSGPWDSCKKPAGFVEINGERAQVQVIVTLDEFDFIESSEGA